MEAAAEFVLEKRRAVLHIYNSISRDVFERYLMEVCHYVVKTYVESISPGVPWTRRTRKCSSATTGASASAT